MYVYARYNLKSIETGSQHLQKQSNNKTPSENNIINNS